MTQESGLRVVYLRKKMLAVSLRGFCSCKSAALCMSKHTLFFFWMQAALAIKFAEPSVK